MTTSALDESRGASMIGGLVDAIGRAVARLRRTLAHRRQTRELLELDDRLLRDMGISRLDVVQALSRPIDADPSLPLAGAGADRTVWRRRPRVE